MKKFIQEIVVFCAFLFALCFIPLGLYYTADPYSDFGIKDNYSWKYRFQSLGDLSTKKLLAATEKPNSFVFGSSRSTGAYACYLEKHIPKSIFFHYANWNEPIEGIYRKLKLIDSLGLDIDNAVLYFDVDKTFLGEGKHHESDHYLVTGESSTKYLADHIRVFFKKPTLAKIKILLHLDLTAEEYPNWESDLKTNDHYHNCSNASVIADYSNIKNDDLYMDKVDSLVKSGFYYKRLSDQQFQDSQISDKEKEVLLGIKDIFVKNYTKYKIVITPLYNQKKFNPTDSNVLTTIFKDNILDYSGINAVTNEPSNYPDLIHFQKYISKNIIDSIVVSRTYEE